MIIRVLCTPQRVVMSYKYNPFFYTKASTQVLKTRSFVLSFRWWTLSTHSSSSDYGKWKYIFKTLRFQKITMEFILIPERHLINFVSNQKGSAIQYRIEELQVKFSTMVYYDFLCFILLSVSMRYMKLIHRYHLYWVDSASFPVIQSTCLWYLICVVYKLTPFIDIDLNLCIHKYTFIDVNCAPVLF
jgi:hypothetical protein